MGGCSHSGAGFEQDIDVCVAEELGFSEQQPAIQATAEAVRANGNLQSDGERHVATGGVQRSESGNLLIQQLIGFEQAGEPRRKILVVQVNGRFDQLERGVVAVLFQLAGLGQRAGGFCGQSVADFSERPDLPAVGDGGPLPGELLSTEESQLV